MLRWVEVLGLIWNDSITSWHAAESSNRAVYTRLQQMCQKWLCLSLFIYFSFHFISIFFFFACGGLCKIQRERGKKRKKRAVLWCCWRERERVECAPNENMTSSQRDCSKDRKWSVTGEANILDSIYMGCKTSFFVVCMFTMHRFISRVRNTSK